MSSTQPLAKTEQTAVTSSQNGRQVQVLPVDEYNRILVANAHPPEWQNPEPAPVYNLVVIGGGSAGLLAVAAAAGLGAKVALIERHLLGGDCLNTGCVPSKTVIRSARLMGDLNRAAELGVTVPAAAADFAAVMERMRRIRAEISHHDSVRRFTDLGVDVFLGEAQFTGPDRLEIGGARLKFKKALLATGSRPVSLPIEGLAEAGYITNETFFSLTERPGRLGVIGAGPIGSELSQAMQRLGCQVTVFDVLPQVLGREDTEAAGLVEQAMRRDGVELVLEAQVKRVSRQGQARVIHYQQHGQARSVQVDEILVAVGRAPNVEGLNLEAAGVAYNTKTGVEVNDYLQTTNPNIYAAGDIALKHRFTHTADASARLVLQNALFLGRKKMSSLTIPWCTYTDPEVAHVGLYPAEAEAAGLAIDTFVQPLSDIDRARADGETEGFVKIYVKKGTDRIVGATIVARHAGDMISEITTAMVGGVGLKTLAGVIHPYPTQAEAIRKVADAYNRSRLTPAVKGLFSRWFRFNRAFNPGRWKQQAAANPIVSLALLTAAALAYYFLSD